MQVFKASTSAVVGLCFMPNGRGIVTGSSAGVAVWDLTDAPERVWQFVSGGLHGCPVTVSPCGRFLVSGGSLLRVFDLTDDSKPELISNGARGLAFAPDGTEFAALDLGAHTRQIFPQRWAVPSWERICTEPKLARPLGQPYCTGAVTYTPDSCALALSFAAWHNDTDTYYDTRIRLFDRSTGIEKAAPEITFGYAHPTQIAYRPDGAVIAGNFGPVLGVVSVADGKEVASIKTGTKHITGLCFTPDGSKLVTVSNDTKVRVIDTRAWKETTGFEWKIGRLRCMAVAPDGLRMAAGSDRGKVVIWDVDE
jgi:WD40 repeat protein